MVKLALIGHDIGYTKSPVVHRAIFDAVGEELKFEVADIELGSLERTANKLFESADAFFITKPYKNDIKRYLSRVETACGVNFVICKTRTGYNTDGLGFIRALDKSFASWRSDVNGVVVLGAGGAAYSVCESLIAAGKRVYVLNRTALNAAKLCRALGAELYLNQPAEMIVNCTTVGALGEDALFDFCVRPDFQYAFDLIYSPEKTVFLEKCERAGAHISNGRDMLVFQAIEGDKMLLGFSDGVNRIYEKIISDLTEKL